MLILFIITSLTWHVEEFTIPVKYKEIFSDLSDVTIPLETLSIGMELGEGKLHQFKANLLLSSNLHVVFSMYIPIIL